MKFFIFSCKQNGKINSRLDSLWPPYRLPAEIHPAYTDPRRMMARRTFHGLLLALLYKAFHEANMSDHLLSLTIYLLELLVEYQAGRHSEGKKFGR